MKIKTGELIELLALLGAAQMSKLESKEKTAVVKAVVAMREEGRRWDAFIKEAQEKCRPEDYEELAGKMQTVDSLPEAERGEVKRRWADYEKAVDEVARPEYGSEREVKAELTEEIIETLADSNPGWSVGAVVALRDAFLGQ